MKYLRKYHGKYSPSATEWGYDQEYAVSIYHLLATVTGLKCEHMIQQSINSFSGILYMNSRKDIYFSPSLSSPPPSIWTH